LRGASPGVRHFYKAHANFAHRVVRIPHEKYGFYALELARRLQISGKASSILSSETTISGELEIVRLISARLQGSLLLSSAHLFLFTGAEGGAVEFDRIIPGLNITQSIRSE
jgi:hypothetical protein